MRAHKFGAAGAMIALAVGFSGAQAQERAGGSVGAQGSGAVQVGTRGAAGTGSMGGTEVEIGGVQTRAAVTPEEQLAQADAITRRAGQLAERLSKMLDEARREKDIMRANCINRKLTEVNANTRNIDQRSRALKDAAAGGDEARRSHEYTVLTVLSQKLETLDQEATQCLGQSVYEPGASQVITTISQGAPTLNPSFIDPSTAAPPSITVPPPNLVTPEEMSPAS